MKKFIVSVVIGGFVGTIMGLSFLYITPKLPTIFAQAFFYPIQDLTSIIPLSNFQKKYKPDSDQYKIDAIDKTIPQEGKVLYADLLSMTISIFENGEQIKQYPIKSIGRDGTAWQTPLGIFDMSYKRENHFSSIGSVWMPYSMHFFGNYFIHGWPYYPSGMPVAEGYSGGCIRLNTPDAQEIFEFVDKETALIVASSEVPHTDTNMFTYRRTDKPNLQSDFVVVDIESGEVLASSNSQETQSIGSFTKLMTALISLETLNQYQEAIFDQNIVTVGDVLYPLLFQDNQSASDVLYQHKNTKQYILDMNTRAKSLGMNSTTYADASGQSEKTISTLDDVVRLFMYFYEYKPFLVQVLGQSEYEKGLIKVENTFDTQEGKYRAGFVSEDNTSMLALLSHDFKKDPESQEVVNKNILILIHQSMDARADLNSLNEWLTQSVFIK